MKAQFPSGLVHKSTDFGYVDDMTLGSSSHPTKQIANKDIFKMMETEEAEVLGDLMAIGSA